LVSLEGNHDLDHPFSNSQCCNRGLRPQQLQIPKRTHQKERAAMNFISLSYHLFFAILGILTGLLFGAIVTIVDRGSGIFIGVFFGCFSYTVGIVLAGCAMNKARSDEYRMY
jgi:hypothetical protein